MAPMAGAISSVPSATSLSRSRRSAMRAIVSVVIAPATATTVNAAPTPLCETS